MPPAAGCFENISAGKAPKREAPGGGADPRRLEAAPWATFARNAGRKQLRAGTDLGLGASGFTPQSRDTMVRVWEPTWRVRRGCVRPRMLALLQTATWRATTVLASDCANQLLAAWDCTFASLPSLFPERLYRWKGSAHVDQYLCSKRVLKIAAWGYPFDFNQLRPRWRLHRQVRCLKCLPGMSTTLTHRGPASRTYLNAPSIQVPRSKSFPLSASL